MDLHPLTAALADYYTPDPDTVSILDKNGVALPYVGHAEITRILCEIDPEWTWAPAAWIDGRPATHLQVGKMRKKDGTVVELPTVTMWGHLTLCGVTRTAVGSVEGHKADLDKELVSDFLRNAAMRFGISLALWAKGTPPARPTITKGDAPKRGPWEPTEGQKRLLYALGHKGDIPTVRNDFDALVEQLKAAKAAVDKTTGEEEPW